MDPAPAPSSRLLLSFTVATFIAALASVWVLGDLRQRVQSLEHAQAGAPQRPARATAPAASPRSERPPEGFPPPKPAPEGEQPDPLASTDPLVKLDALLKAQQEASDSLYEYYSDMLGDLVAIKREIRQLKASLRNVSQALAAGRPGGLSLGWGLAPARQPLGADVAKAYVEDAKRFGIEVEPGRVTARAMLNMSPNEAMPIEYFITRFPESGHETLVHLVGAGTLGDAQQDPLKDLRGLSTALYKALVAAGFREGEGSRVEEPARPVPGGAPAGEGQEGAGTEGAGEPVEPAPPVLVLATGDTVYLYVRYTLDGQVHLARATDWVLDPSTGAVLPEDCWRFTGSRRVPDPETGEEMLAAEMGGLLVSVWPNASALLEVALASAVNNDYRYHHARIPRPRRPEGAPAEQPIAPLALDLIFSSTPLPLQGDGARPLEAPKPPAGAPAPGAR
ncbi:MAG: hypothetical protein ACKOCB_00275 [Planctomycetia bacterium]